MKILLPCAVLLILCFYLTISGKDISVPSTESEIALTNFSVKNFHTAPNYTAVADSTNLSEPAPLIATEDLSMK